MITIGVAVAKGDGTTLLLLLLGDVTGGTIGMTITDGGALTEGLQLVGTIGNIAEEMIEEHR